MERRDSGEERQAREQGRQIAAPTFFRKMTLAGVLLFLMFQAGGPAIQMSQISSDSDMESAPQAQMYRTQEPSGAEALPELPAGHPTIIMPGVT